MTPTREAAELRDLAALLLAASERVGSILRLGMSDDSEDVLQRIRLSLDVDADRLSQAAEDMAPTPWMPDLFKWARGKSVPAVRT